MCGSQEIWIFGSSAVAESLRSGSGHALRPGPSWLLRRCLSESLILAPVPWACALRLPFQCPWASQAGDEHGPAPALWGVRTRGIPGAGCPARRELKSWVCVPAVPVPVTAGGVRVLSRPLGFRAAGAALPAGMTPPTPCLAPPSLSLPWGSSSPGELQAQVPRGLWVPRVSGSSGQGAGPGGCWEPCQPKDR